MKRAFLTLAVILFPVFLVSCGSTEIVESPKTAYVATTDTPKEPTVIWTSRAFGDGYDYLGKVSVRSLTYDGAMERLKEGGRQLHADALIDVHYEQVGFLTTLDGFAVKIK